MKRLAALSIMCVLAGGVLSLARPALAQTTATSTPVLTPAPISLDISGTSQADFTTQLTALQTTYRNQLTTYRDNEKTFQIDKDQYYKIQTLASLEEAVRATRQVMLTRADVLLTYLTISRLTLQNTKGIDTAVKTDALQQIDTLSSDLKDYRKTVDVSQDRTALLNTAIQFLTLNSRTTALSRRIYLLVGYGNLQTVDDKTFAIKQELQTQVEQTETDPLVLAQKKRGLDEIQRNLDQINPPLTKVRFALDPVNKNNSSVTGIDFNQNFTAIYGGLSRSLSYLQEIVKN